MAQGCRLRPVTDVTEWDPLFLRVEHPQMNQAWAYGEARQAAGAGWRATDIASGPQRRFSRRVQRASHSLSSRYSVPRIPLLKCSVWPGRWPPRSTHSQPRCCSSTAMFQYR
jgi:hypothetical protein